MTAKIKLKPRRRTVKGSKPWRESYPFAVNPRGILTHRVRHVTTHFRGGEKSHHSLTYLCGNCCCFSLGDETEVLVSKPPKDRMLCAFCEAAAQRRKLPSGDKLAGRHVHIGVLKAVQVCCRAS